MHVHVAEILVLARNKNAWIIGNEPCVAIDFTGMKEYANVIDDR